MPEEHPLTEAIVGEYDGFLTYYSGNGDTPAAFGVSLDCFDEADAYNNIASLKLEPTDAQKREFDRLWDHVDVDLKPEIEKYGQPRTFFLWTTS